MSLDQREVLFSPRQNEIHNVDQSRQMAAANESIAEIQGDKRKREKIQAGKELLAEEISFNEGGYKNDKLDQNGQIAVVKASLADLQVETQQAVKIARARKIRLHSGGFHIDNMVQNKPVAAADSLLADHQCEKQESEGIQTANETLVENFSLYKCEFENDNIDKNIPLNSENASVSKLRVEKQQAANVLFEEKLPVNSSGFETDNLIQNRQLTALEEHDTNSSEIQEDIQTDINIQAVNAPLSELPTNPGGIKIDNIVRNRQLAATKESDGNFGGIQNVIPGIEIQAANAPLAEELTQNPCRIEIDNIVQNRQLAPEDIDNDEERHAYGSFVITMMAAIDMSLEPIYSLHRCRG